jgi:predicted nucleic acid-binding protein
MILLDSNVILDIWDADPVWSRWSLDQVRRQCAVHELAINPIIYTEISPRFRTPVALDDALTELGVKMLDLPRNAAFLAGRAHLLYRRKGGTKTGVLSDFFIGAHTVVLGCALLTRDPKRYTAYFPTVSLITP